jgi:hypothetical protein
MHKQIEQHEANCEKRRQSGLPRLTTDLGDAAGFVDPGAGNSRVSYFAAPADRCNVCVSEATCRLGSVARPWCLDPPLCAQAHR